MRIHADPDPQLLAGTAYRYADISVAIYCLLKSTLQEPPFLAASGPDPAPDATNILWGKLLSKFCSSPQRRQLPEPPNETRLRNTVSNRVGTKIFTFA